MLPWSDRFVRFICASVVAGAELPGICTSCRTTPSMSAPGWPLMRAGVVPALRTLMPVSVTPLTGPDPRVLPVQSASQVRLLSLV